MKTSRFLNLGTLTALALFSALAIPACASGDDDDDAAGDGDGDGDVGDGDGDVGDGDGDGDGDGPTSVCDGTSSKPADSLIADVESGVAGFDVYVSTPTDAGTITQPASGDADDDPTHAADGAPLDTSMGGSASTMSVEYAGTGWLSYGAGMNFNLEGCKDVSDYTGVSFWAKGSTKNLTGQTLTEVEDNALNFRVSTAGSHGMIFVGEDNVGGDCDTTKTNHGCFNPPQTNIELTAEWKQYKVPFADLKVPSGAAPGSAINAEMDNVMLLGWHSENAEFEFYIDQVEYYSE